MDNDELTSILDWARGIIEGVGGLEAFDRYEIAISRESDHVTGAHWAITCLANPDCEGSAAVLDAIIERRRELKEFSDKEAERPIGTQSITKSCARALARAVVAKADRGLA